MAAKLNPGGKMRPICLVIFFCTVRAMTLEMDPRNDFYHHVVVRPSVYRTPDMERRDDQVFQAVNDDQLTLEFEAFGKNFSLDLHMNKGLLPERFFEKYEENGKEIFRQPMKEGDGKHCHYQGHVQNEVDSWAAVSLCNGISGVISDGKELYYIEPDLLSKNKHFLFKAADIKPENYRCGVNDYEVAVAFENQFSSALEKQQKRSIKVPYVQSTAPHIVELLFVADYDMYTKYQQRTANVIERCKNVVNIMNALYVPLNTYVALVGVIVWSNGNKIQVVADPDSTLDAFAKYREDNLLNTYPNDVAQLISGIKFTAPTLGLAFTGAICSASTSAGIIMDHKPTVGIVAATSAHELGHNFGMKHDTASCQCLDPSTNCIMKDSIGSVAPTIWSSCSRTTIQDTLARDDVFCLLNAPSAVEGPVCGNGFVEGSEQCDCGPAQFCTSRCCDPATCRLYSNATCATGSCCDTSTCRIKRARTVCRSAISECDKAESCNGRSEYCPDDIHERDGKECANRQKYCYDGKCRSHDDQCRTLWGPTARKSDDICYNRNTQGSAAFNCGFDKRHQTYLPCSQGDALCGRLQCQQTAPEPVASAKSYYGATLTRGGQVSECYSVFSDVGNIDFGLTQNGAKCGQGRMCRNQRCVAV